MDDLKIDISKVSVKTLSKNFLWLLTRILLHLKTKKFLFVTAFLDEMRKIFNDLIPFEKTQNYVGGFIRRIFCPKKL